jgi:NAD(P)-dependent dehydrogenase (short-subunit alcohol dehydrogenase family)
MAEPQDHRRIGLVTGGNKGIGRAIVAGLAEEGHVVYLGARDTGRGSEAAKELCTFGDVRFIQLDVTSQSEVDAAVQRIGSDFGRLDALINNAGVNIGNFRHLDHFTKPTEETADALRNVYEVNVFAVVRVINAFLPLLFRSPSGRIVNVTSKRGSIGEEGAWWVRRR